MKHTTSRIIGALALMTLFTSLAPAQTSGNPPDIATRVQRRVAFLTTMLSLTPAQQQQATTLFTTAANTKAGLHAGLKAGHQNLVAAVKNDDSGAIQEAATTLGSLTTQLIEAEATAYAGFYKSLTPDQQTKASALYQHMAGRFGHAGGAGGR